jgi:hypothetical protein
MSTFLLNQHKNQVIKFNPKSYKRTQKSPKPELRHATRASVAEVV